MLIGLLGVREQPWQAAGPGRAALMGRRNKRAARFGGWLGVTTRVRRVPTLEQAEQMREVSRASGVSLLKLHSLLRQRGWAWAWPWEWPGHR